MRLNRRRAFTLTEIAISIMILGIMAAGIALSSNASKQTAKNEANKIAALINRVIESAERQHGAFWFTAENNNFYVAWGRTFSESAKENLNFKLSPGCSFSVSPANIKGFGYNIGDENSGFVTVLTYKTPSVTVKVSDTDIDSTAKKFTLIVKGEGGSQCYVHLFAE